MYPILGGQYIADEKLAEERSTVQARHADSLILAGYKLPCQELERNECCKRNKHQSPRLLVMRRSRQHANFEFHCTIFYSIDFQFS
jgi:hypothetical protein